MPLVPGVEAVQLSEMLDELATIAVRPAGALGGVAVAAGVVTASALVGAETSGVGELVS